MPDEKVAACPWCKLPPMVIDGGRENDSSFFVSCYTRGCAAKGPLRPTKGEAVASWNKFACPPSGREEFAEERDHLTVTGAFQPDKYDWCPAGFVPLKITDPAARDLLAEYARRREPIDVEFPRDLLEALENIPAKSNPNYQPFVAVQQIESERDALALACAYASQMVSDRESIQKYLRDALENLAE